MGTARSRTTPLANHGLALLLALASPVLGSAAEVTTARCDEHPPVEPEAVDSPLRARLGLTHFEYERWKADGAKTRARADEGSPMADVLDIGGGPCPKQLAGVQAVGAITYYGTQHCTGTLVAPRVVLTAAHCVDRFDATQMEFRVGSDGARRERGKFAKAFRARLHDAYLPERLGWNDVAVLYLEKELKNVAPVGYRTERYRAVPTNPLAFIGYGNPESDVPGSRRCLQLRVKHVCNVAFDDAARSYTLESFDYHEPDRGTCRGDSGGAALESDGEGWRLTGLTSWGAARCDALGVSMDVGAYSDFIGRAILEAPRAPPRFAWAFRWAPVVAAGFAAGFGAYAVDQLYTEGDLRDDAKALVRVDGTIQDPITYNRMLEDAREAHLNARQAGYWALASGLVTGISSYFSYRMTGQFTPFRF